MVTFSIQISLENRRRGPGVDVLRWPLPFAGVGPAALGKCCGEPFVYVLQPAAQLLRYAVGDLPGHLARRAFLAVLVEGQPGDEQPYRISTRQLGYADSQAGGRLC
jgi:hypothetical protein